MNSGAASCLCPVHLPVSAAPFCDAKAGLNSTRVFSCPAHSFAVHKLSARKCNSFLGPCRSCLHPQKHPRLRSSRSRKLRSVRLHATDHSADGDSESPEEDSREDRSSSSGEIRSVSTNELSEEDVSERWEGGQSRAEASPSGGENLKTRNESLGPSDSRTASSEARAEGAAGEEAQTRRVLDILHRRKEPARNQGQSLRERFGGFRVSGPQVPLTLQPLTAQKGERGPPEKSETGVENEEGAETGVENEEGANTDVSQQTVSESLQEAQTDSEAATDSGESEDAGESTSGEKVSTPSAAELIAGIMGGSESKAGKSNETGEKKKKPIVIPPGPSVAEIPIPPRTDEDERLIAVFEKKLNADWKVDGVESELELYIAKVKALESFKAELARPDEDINLVRAAALIAQHAYPEASPEACEAELRFLAEDLKHELPPPGERYPLRMIAAINKFLYEERGFQTNQANDYEERGVRSNRGANADERLSLNNVLKSKLGDRLLVSLIYLELARRVGFPMQAYTLAGVYMVVRPLAADSLFYIDVADKGKLMFHLDVQAKLRQMFFATVFIAPDYIEKKQPISKREWLLRMLTTLKDDYLRNRNFVRCLAIIEYLKIAHRGPRAATELRDAGVCLFSLRRIPEAVASLEQYLAMAPSAPDAKYVREWLQKIREGRMGGSD